MIAAPFVVLCPAVSMQSPGAMLATTGVPAAAEEERVVLVPTKLVMTVFVDDCEVGILDVMELDETTLDVDRLFVLLEDPPAPVFEVAEGLGTGLFDVMVVMVVGKVLNAKLLVETLGLDESCAVEELDVDDPA